MREFLLSISSAGLLALSLAACGGEGGHEAPAPVMAVPTPVVGASGSAPVDGASGVDNSILKASAGAATAGSATEVAAKLSGAGAVAGGGTPLSAAASAVNAPAPPPPGRTAAPKPMPSVSADSAPTARSGRAGGGGAASASTASAPLTGGDAAAGAPTGDSAAATAGLDSHVVAAGYASGGGAGGGVGDAGGGMMARPVSLDGGGAASLEMGSKAAEATTDDVTHGPDAEDYFTRIEMSQSIFYVVKKRYNEVTFKWAKDSPKGK